MIKMKTNKGFWGIQILLSLFQLFLSQHLHSFTSLGKYQIINVLFSETDIESNAFMPNAHLKSAIRFAQVRMETLDLVEKVMNIKKKSPDFNLIMS